MAEKRITRIPATPTPPKRTRTVAYARVSSGKDAMLHSLSAQISHYSALIQNNPEWEYVGVYADEALTGTKDNRPQLQKLLADCRAGLIDQVLVKSVSRLARNTVTLLEVVREFRLLGVDIYFERENIHTMSAEGELMLTLIASIAQEESLSTSENCKWRIRKGFKDGEVWHVRPYGYSIVDDDYVIVESEAAVVRMIFTDYLSGMGLNAITRKLNDLGIPFGDQPRWMESTVRKMLRNERYVGDMLLQKTFVADHLTKQKKPNRGELPRQYVQDSHEPILERGLFDAVQQRLAARSTMCSHEFKGHGLYPFTGVLSCAHCGKPYRRKINASGTKYAKPVWICRTYNQHGKKHCASKQIPEDILIVATAAVLGVDAVDAALIARELAGIDVLSGNTLRYRFIDGRVVERVWHDRSRSESWDDAARARAREHKRGQAAK